MNRRLLLFSVTLFIIILFSGTHMSNFILNISITFLDTFEFQLYKVRSKQLFSKFSPAGRFSLSKFNNWLIPLPQSLCANLSTNILQVVASMSLIPHPMQEVWVQSRALTYTNSQALKNSYQIPPLELVRPYSPKTLWPLLQLNFTSHKMPIGLGTCRAKRYCIKNRVI